MCQHRWDLGQRVKWHIWVHYFKVLAQLKWIPAAPEANCALSERSRRSSFFFLFCFFAQKINSRKYLTELGWQFALAVLWTTDMLPGQTDQCLYLAIKQWQVNGQQFLLPRSALAQWIFDVQYDLEKPWCVDLQINPICASLYFSAMNN